MKILHLITNLGIGGAESFLVYLLEKFKNCKDKHCIVYFRSGPNVEKIKELGFPVYKISGLFCLYDPWFYWCLKKLIKKIRPDVIHSSLWSANIFGRIIAKRLSIPIICDLHNDCSYNGNLRNFLEKVTLSVPNRLVAVSYSIGKSFEGCFVDSIKIRSKRKRMLSKLAVIPNGIDFHALQAKAFDDDPLTKKDLGFSQNDFVVGSIGRLEPIKSYDILVRAFAQLVKSLENASSVKLCLVGDGFEKERLIQLAKELGIGNKVYFAGQQPKAYKFYPLFDCFALSSQTEGLSIATLEAMCFSLPVVTTHAFKTHEVIVNGHNGFLIPPKDVDGFAKALKCLYLDASLTAAIGKNNQEFVKSNFDINTAVISYNQLYKDIAFLSNSKIE